MPNALKVNNHNGKHCWRESINKDMPKIENAVDEYDGDPTNIIGYQQITGHMIFDVNMGKNFHCNAIIFGQRPKD